MARFGWAVLVASLLLAGGASALTRKPTATANPTPPVESPTPPESPTATESSPTQTASPTASPTSNRPPASAKGKAVPNPAHPGDVVQLLDDGSFGGVAGRFWTQEGLPPVQLTGVASEPSFVAPQVDGAVTLTFRYEVCNYDSGCATDFVAVTVQPPAACLGDCDGSGAVQVDELLSLVKLVLGADGPTTCGTGPGRVFVSHVVGAVANALAGCSSPLVSGN
jgi:hypothetical protein